MSRRLSKVGVFGQRLCQQVQFFFAAICFLLTESICRRTGNDVQSVYSLNNNSPEPICLPAACHSFLLPFLHTFAFTSVREAAVAVYVFCLFPHVPEDSATHASQRLKSPGSIQTALFSCLSSRKMYGSQKLPPWVFTCQRSCLLQRKYRTCPIFFLPIKTAPMGTRDD